MNISNYQNKKNLLILNSNEWILMPFSDLLQDNTRNLEKIPSNNYLNEAKYPVIDQGKKVIAGYSNLENPFKEESIIFGDHTRILKYIDYPFHIGADGVKVLVNKMKDSAITKYIYYYLTSIEIPNTGYNRHFKFLKEIVIPLPSLEQQKKIVSVLDKAYEIITKRQSQIAALDELTQSLFLEMFGDPIYNTRNWNKVCFGDVISVLTDYHANGSYQVLKNHVELLDEENYALMIRTTDLERQKYTEDVKYITEEAYNFLTKTQMFGGEIIINKIGSAGKVYIMPDLNRPVSLGMNQFMILVNSKANNQFIYYLLNTKAGQNLIQNRVQGAVTKSITKDAVRSIPIILPPIDLQNEFDNKLEQINSHKNLLQNSLQSMQELYQSLLQNAFKGELFQK
ncbi:restriction endonuclease subunit S [Bacillus sp. 007/AIA-02/001]|uniref:restriction endonuclease subunit S n=1 Tax=Bacillus sp. 007/AIA-02/001 TaxID=2509009 RepID=UPI0010753584|nr:restriction endonuclease subunit S [Bacillus sp. 007/AIA-02/001]TFW53945.1 restriction endonuclease subunit S [Bacillus sp. 007/AIA-02/001]